MEQNFLAFQKGPSICDKSHLKTVNFIRILLQDGCKTNHINLKVAIVNIFPMYLFF